MENRGFGILFLIALGVVGIVLATRSSNPVPATPSPGFASAQSARQYNYHPVAYENEEVREILYNSDGLPVKITIHRHASVA